MISVSSKWFGMALRTISKFPSFKSISSILIFMYQDVPLSVSQLCSDMFRNHELPSTAPLNFTPGMVPGTGLIAWRMAMALAKARQYPDLPPELTLNQIFIIRICFLLSQRLKVNMFDLFLPSFGLLKMARAKIFNSQGWRDRPCRIPGSSWWKG